MKKFYFLLFMLLSCLMTAAELPKQWDLWYWNPDDKTFLRVHTPDSPGFKSLQNVHYRGKTELTEAGIDLNTAARGWGAAFFRGSIHSEKDQTMWLGVGCRIFSVVLNGNVIYDLRWKGLGNDFQPVTAKDHIFALPLKSGRNEIVISTKRTNFLMDYCYGANRDIEWRLAVKEHKNYSPAKAELAHPEMVLRPDKGSFMFSFVTKSPVPAGIDYRVKGTDRWVREWDLAGDFILREKSRIHRIRINDVPSGKDVEYRIVLLEPPAGLDGMRRALWTNRQYKEVLLPVKTLRNPDRKEFSFFVFGDTQLSISTTCRTVEDRKNFMNRMRSIPEYKKSDFIVHIGDEDSYFHNVEDFLLTNFFDNFSVSSGEIVQPWILVRGNHEADGLAAEDWYDYFQMPEDKSYYAFRLGNVLFISLDCGDFSAKTKYSSFNGPVTDLDSLYKRQSAWLEKLRRTKAYKQAKYRIILSHSEPQISNGEIERKIRELTAPLLNDDSPEGRIHLWIAGHVHQYWRAAKGARTLVARNQRKNPALKFSPVNWVSVDGPKGNSSNPNFSYLYVKVTEKEISVKAVDENGRPLDEFTVDQTGNFKELFRSKELKDMPFLK